jgi:hypothetical protein
MKIIVSIMLMAAILITSSIPVLANRQSIATPYNIFIELEKVSLAALDLRGFLPQEQHLSTLVLNDGTTHVLTFIENANRSTSLFLYINGILAEINNVIPGSGRYETVKVKDGNRNAVVSRETTIIDGGASAHALTIQPLRNTRHLGYAHYRNAITGQIRSIRGYVDEWLTRDIEMRIVTNQTWNTIGNLVSAIIGFFGVPASIASGILGAFATLFAISAVNGLVTATTTTTILGDHLRQDIRGVPATSGGRNATLPRSERLFARTSCGRVRAHNIANTGGYSTADWGMSHLGIQLFWRVFEIEVIPTSWTGI